MTNKDEVISDFIILKGMMFGETKNMFTDMYIKKFGDFRCMDDGAWVNKLYPDLLMIKLPNSLYNMVCYHPLLPGTVKVREYYYLGNDMGNELFDGYRFVNSILLSTKRKQDFSLHRRAMDEFIDKIKQL